ncbi:hypothetical protein A3J90_02875 [candidate division WOR-1 bacterium RIFOXYC2_FULL_37_10]|uniref:Uncharacterized protein n=1 Tax=candidate division WOR-1 bacterium RIFOXYB2_FULL_37_13 TaxID=1802579 RepID=A0A1F4SP84_UNCSA|nr:MAG: hypothetical protein A2246_01825 [candidate division WOR-1 bacterium RIFOXYA2_FULL_37_7]OGC22264.1 MAG: hypothetical protein A2310_01555 [candidate division WOR-1 bacterium RIFOXYB2_FULL_37_13]OGC34556.1 MAG: hypothetical protein A3J90_02875 [candidate division WOR-1 bacterium RIFOXYC2_FULL_37_10]
MTSVSPSVTAARRAMYEMDGLFVALRKKGGLSIDTQRKVAAHVLGQTGREGCQECAARFIASAEVVAKEGIDKNPSFSHVQIEDRGNACSALIMSGAGVKERGLDGSSHLVFWERDVERGSQAEDVKGKGNPEYHSIVSPGEAMQARLDTVREFNDISIGIDEIVRRVRASDWSIMAKIIQNQKRKGVVCEEMLVTEQGSAHRSMLGQLFEDDGILLAPLLHPRPTVSATRSIVFFLRETKKTKTTSSFTVYASEDLSERIPLLFVHWGTKV